MTIIILSIIFIVGYIWFRVVMDGRNRRSRRREFNIRRGKQEEED